MLSLDHLSIKRTARSQNWPCHDFHIIVPLLCFWAFSKPLQCLTALLPLQSNISTLDQKSECISIGFALLLKSSNQSEHTKARCSHIQLVRMFSLFLRSPRFSFIFIIVASSSPLRWSCCCLASPTVNSTFL